MKSIQVISYPNLLNCFEDILLHCGNSGNVLINSVPAAVISLSDTWILDFNVCVFMQAVYACERSVESFV